MCGPEVVRDIGSSDSMNLANQSNMLLATEGEGDNVVGCFAVAATV
jgi:hypothetical protein